MKMMLVEEEDEEDNVNGQKNEIGKVLDAIKTCDH